MSDNQPTNDELITAMRISKALHGSCTGGDAFHDLKRIRERRTTWVGEEDNALRVRLDRYIDNHGGGFHREE